jgi:peptide/nickel transport system substrate-binding protein
MRGTMKAAACTLALALLACSDKPSSDRKGSDAKTFGGGPTGGTLVVLADREPDQLNPLTYNSAPALQAVHLMFRALARRDTTLSSYAPDLATEWTLESDSTLVISLRDDVLWHDSTRVTADDVIYTIEMQKDVATGSPRQSDVDPVRSATARDSFTVEVKLDHPNIYTINALLELVPVPRHLLHNVAAADMKNAPFNRAPVGNGFYRFESWTAGQNLTLAVNEAVPEGRASIDRIVMRFIPDINAAMTEVLTGGGDLIPKLPATQKQSIAASDAAKVYGAKRVRPAWVAWNTRRPPFDDVRVRRAVLMGIDRDALAKGLFGELGEAALSPIPAALREHSATARPVPFDVEGAKKLLADAGWRDTNGDSIVEKAGRPLRFEIDFISSDQTRQDVLVAIQSMLGKIGADMVPRAYESTAWVQRLREGSFTGSLWGWGWGPGVVGPNANMIFHSRSAPPNGPNFAGAANSRIDALIEQVLATTDSVQARTIWGQLEQALIDDAVYAPIYMDPELIALHARFQGVRMRGIEWWEDVPYWSVDPARALPRDRMNK